MDSSRRLQLVDTPAVITGDATSSDIPAPLFTPLVLRDIHTRINQAATTDVARAVLMCSPAGSGKTVLAAEWLRRHRRLHPDTRFCWLTISETLDNAARLWAAVRAELGLPAERGHQLADPMGSAIDLAQELAGQQPAVLVLDDAHLLTDPLALAGLEQFLKYAPARVTTIVTGRYEPPLRWHALDIAGRLLRLGATDLAFGPEQIASVFVEHGCPLDDSEIASIQQLTRGWAALVRIAAIYTAMHGPDRADALAMLAHAPHPISDFLVGELIEALDADVREFLLVTCVPESFTEALAEELAGPRAPRMLDDLARINFPVQHTTHADRIRYSYHPMLRAYLLAELQRSAPQRIPDLHRIAGCWYLSAGTPLAALPHLLAEPGQPRLPEFIREYGLHVVLDGAGSILFEKLDAATARLLDDPYLRLLRVIDAVERGDHAAAAAYLDQIRANGPVDSVIVTDAWAAAARLAAAAAVAVATGIESASSDELESAPHRAEPPTTGQPDLDCYVAIQLGTIRAFTGAGGAASRMLHRALALAEHIGHHRMQLRAVTRLAAAAALAGQVTLMRERATRAVDLGAEYELTHLPDHVQAVAIGALAAHLQGDDITRLDLAALSRTRRGLDGASEPIAGRHAYIIGLLLTFDETVDKHAAAMSLHAEMHRLLAEPPHPPLGGRLLIPVVAILLRLHERDAAQQLADAGHRALHGAPDSILAAAAVSEAANKPLDTLDMVAPLLKRSAELPAYTAVTAWLLYASACHRLDRQVKSYEGFAEAVRLASPDRLVRPFFEVPGVLTMLHEHAGRFGADNGFVETVRENSAARPQPMSPALTDAELTVLKQLPSGRTALQIAQDLGVSINTVKTHLRSIYTKLGSNSRADAMLRARRIGVL
ncbi:LuxR C-terminal-related transcriptional regulator [Nocardia sp. NPDC005366]|uniref:LuxR C-terminal-related transcriptional regulator n=1 Tax=Nocardia sp. NPDC005366 TaxID=3156878 RepID=UPI0033A088B2